MVKTISAVFALLLFLIQPQTSAAQSTERIAEYKTDIVINADSSVRITETIQYDFGTQNRHGIYRDIPYKYRARGGTFALRLSDISVSADALPVPFEQSTTNGNVRLKVGDPDKTITGIHNYSITYTVRRAINQFDDHDELYWNAIGASWNVPIEKSTVTVTAPGAINQAVCFVGAEGSTDQSCLVQGVNTNTVTMHSQALLEPEEGLTVVVGMPPGTVAAETWQQRLLYIIQDNGILALPVFVFLAMFFIWRKWGRDAHGKTTIVPQYEPPAGLTPLAVGTIIDGSVGNKDLSAEIIYVAIRGHLSIERLETKKLLFFKGVDYALTPKQEPAATAPESVRELWNALFPDKTPVTLSDLKKDQAFGMALAKIKSNVYKQLATQAYFRANPTIIKGLFITAGAIVGGGGAFLLGTIFDVFGVVAALVSGLIIIVFAFIMPALTAKGVETKAYIQGLKGYLSVAEKERLEFHNAPEKNPQRFEMLLPFAIALGVEKQWAKQFEGIYATKPGWYTDSTGTAFNAFVFTSAVGDFSESLTSAMTTASGGGSGFSGGGAGGGGGGGGGGSW